MADRPELFVPETDPAQLADLRARLRATRWPDAPEDGWALGADVGYLRELIAYWADEFDWTKQESALARLPRYRVRLGGSRIHFVHARAVAPNGPALPLVLTHGWPDSFWRYSKVIPLLADPGAHGGDPADAFDVIVPDMPGYGYSDRPTGPAPDSVAVAGLWAELMTVLGYARFAAAGGDIGSSVSRFLALDHPDRVVAVHRMDAGLPAFVPDDLTPEERSWLQDATAWGAAEGAYAGMHRTKPQTAAVGLTDSPAGLAAWIVEKLRAWSDCGGDVERAFTKDEILTNVTIYWLTGTIGSAMRMYRANAAIPPEQHARRVEVPSGFSLFPADLARAPRAWLDRMANTVRITEPERGGHFAPFEEPELYARELRDFFRPFRTA
ncbi:epoxide hydrolase family protein [Amycolatopsis echigonensis]|uniref:Alpha/beta fold hydrolase n=1 Tax=Amycolatopsis echigonensis TaxID=2576905 RepID=A0A2N3WVE1_9PSEU|nr:MULTISPECIES: epoxide hydrolase [Amycolatopsis]MBB2504793.1 alpha/beta fold hydrolase [Amycolatopsis echigonensis]PKV97824.1 pimeloyl-ACP methyl ester carboxylesterase [Amycolatopsis niigatensis]